MQRSLRHLEEHFLLPAHVDAQRFADPYTDRPLARPILTPSRCSGMMRALAWWEGKAMNRLALVAGI